MANEYYYDIVYLDTVTSSSGNANAVETVHWHLVGTHPDGTIARFGDSTTINPEPSESSEFVAFESLTANTVLSWVESSVTDDQLNRCKMRIDNLIEQERNPKTAKDIPWA
jgi:hypothetical protein